MDEQVGQILEELEQDGLLESTVIFWFSDHGGPLPRQKRLLYDETAGADDYSLSR